MVRLSAWLAIAVGMVLAIAQVVRNYDNLENWPTWVVDEAAAAVLVVAGILTIRRRASGLLPVAWAFSCGLYTSAAIAHMNTLDRVSVEIYAAERQLLILIAGVLTLSFAGLAMALYARGPQ